MSPAALHHLAIDADGVFELVVGEREGIFLLVFVVVNGREEGKSLGVQRRARHKKSWSQNAATRLSTGRPKSRAMDEASMSSLVERSSDGPLASSSTSTTQSAPFFWNSETTAAFPPAFRQFLEANDIHPDNYAISGVRIRCRVRPDTRHHTNTNRARASARHLAIEPVDWLPGYFCVPSHIKIAGCDAYLAIALWH